MDLFTLAAKLKLDSSSFETGIKKSEKSFSKFGKSVGSGLKKVAKVGTVAFAAVGAASLAFAKSAIKTGSEFDSAMSQVAATMGLTSTKIKKNLNGAGDSFKMLAAKAREMGAQTIYSATEAAQGLNILAQSGMTAKESVGMIGDVLHLAAAGNIDMASSASYLSQAMKGFKEKGKTSTNYADLIAKGATLASTSVQQLGEALGSAAATGKSYGQSSKSVTLALLRLADQGVRGSAASTALNAAMKDVYKTSGQGAKTLKQLGVSAYNSKGKARDFNAVINDINKATSKMSSKKRTEALQKIFGIQGFKAYNKMAATSTKKQKQWSKELGKSAGEAEKQYKTMTDNLEGDVSAFNSAVSEAKITLSEKMMPTIRKFVQEGTGWVDKLTKAFQRDGLSGALSVASEFISSITERLVKKAPEILAAGWEIMKALGKGIWSGINAIKWPSWDDVKSFAIKAWDEIKAGVADLGGLIFGYKKTATGEEAVAWPDWNDVFNYANYLWEELLKFVADLGGLIFGKKVVDGQEVVNWPSLSDIFSYVLYLWDSLLDYAKNLGGLIFGVKIVDGEEVVNWPSVSELIRYAKGDIWDKLVEAVSEFTGLKFGGSAFADDTTSVFETLIKRIKSLDWSSIGSAIYEAISSYLSFNSISQLFSNIFAGGEDGALQIDWSSLGSKIVEFVKQGIIGLGDLIAGYFKSAYDDSIRNWEAIGAFFQGLIDDICRIIETVVGFVSSNVIEPVKGVIQEIITWFDTNIINPIVEIINSVPTAVQSVIDTAQQIIQEIVEWFDTNIITPISQFIDNVKKTIDSVIEDAKKTIKDIVSWFDSNIVSPIKSSIDTILGPFQTVVNTITSWIKKPETKVINVKTVSIGGTPVSNTTSNGNFVALNLVQRGGGQNRMVPKAKGDWNVPYDNYPAMLHRNEMVLTASQARQYREGQSSSMNLAALTSAITRAVKDGMANANVNAFIDGQRVTDNVSRRIANEFRSMRYAT